MSVFEEPYCSARWNGRPMRARALKRVQTPGLRPPPEQKESYLEKVGREIKNRQAKHLNLDGCRIDACIECGQPCLASHLICPSCTGKGGQVRKQGAKSPSICLVPSCRRKRHKTKSKQSYIFCTEHQKIYQQRRNAEAKRKLEENNA